MSKKKEQRLVFILSDDGNGNINVEAEFFPRLPLSEEGQKELPPWQQNLQTIAASIGKSVMGALKKNLEETEKNV